MLIPLFIIDFLYLTSIFSGLFLVIVILYKDYKNPINFFLGAATIFALGRVYFVYLIIKSNYSSYLWTKMAYLSVVPIPVLYLFFVRFFVDKTAKFRIFDIVYFLPIPLLWFLFSEDLILTNISLLSNNTLREVHTPLIIIFATYFISYFVYGYLLLIKKYINSSGNEKIQVMYVLLGTFIPSFLSVFINILIPYFDISLNMDLYNIAPITTLFLTLFVFVAIIKYKFMDFHYYFGRGIFFTTLAAIASSMYFLMLFIIARFFQNFGNNQSFFVNLLVFFILSILFDPIRRFIEYFTNRFFSRTRIDFDKTITEILSYMDFTNKKTEFLDKVLKIIYEKMLLNGACFLVFDEQKDRFEILSAEGNCKDLLGYTLTRNYPLIEFLEKTNQPIDKAIFEKNIFGELSSQSKKEFLLKVLIDIEKIGVSLCVPGRVKDRLILVLLLFDKKSGEMFTVDEVDFFVTIANQISVYIQNLVLFEKEKEAIRIAAELAEKTKYIEELEIINKDLLKTRESLAKTERISTASKLAISLQHEINNPLTSVLAITQALLVKIRNDTASTDFIKEKISVVKSEANRIKQLLEKLTDISEPIIREYMPGIEMIDLNVSENG